MSHDMVGFSRFHVSCERLVASLYLLELVLFPDLGLSNETECPCITHRIWYRRHGISSIFYDEKFRPIYRGKGENSSTFDGKFGRMLRGDAHANLFNIFGI